MSVPNNKRKLQHIRKSENVENWFTSVPGKYTKIHIQIHKLTEQRIFLLCSEEGFLIHY